MNERSRILALWSGILFLVFVLLALSIYSSSSLTSGVITFDHTIDVLLQGSRTVPYLPQIMLLFTFLGNPEVVIVFEAGVLMLILLSQRKRVATLFLAGSLIGEAVSLLFKYIIERTRPTGTIFHVIAHGYSFPSGHALIAMVFYGSIGLFLAHNASKRWQKIWIGILTAVVILAIGFSRVYLEVHWASDVIGGWLLGGAFLAAIAALFYRIHKHQVGGDFKDLAKPELIGFIVVALLLGFFIVYYLVTHLPELRSIV